MADEQQQAADGPNEGLAAQPDGRLRPAGELTPDQIEGTRSSTPIRRVEGVRPSPVRPLSTEPPKWGYSDEDKPTDSGRIDPPGR